MAYFSNGSEGMVFDEECSTCRYGLKPCPIALMQITYNYDACNNKVARKILDGLISNNGECSMKQTFKTDFEKIIDKNQTLINFNK